MDKRDFKTHPQQWSAIVDFGEEHPTIFRPQFKHGDGDAGQHAKLWETLADTLNSMGFGFRSVDKWKMAIGRWKSKTKAKAAHNRMEAGKTGGGPSNAVPLTDLEKRLMNLMGWKSVSGDENAELGMGPIATHFPPTGQDHNIPPPEPQPSCSRDIEIPAHSANSPPPLALSRGPARKRSFLSPESQSSDNTEMKGPAHLSKSPLMSTPARKRSRLSTEKSRKYVTLSKMHHETMEERKKLRNIASRQAEAQEEIAKTLKDIFDYYKTKDNL